MSAEPTTEELSRGLLTGEGSSIERLRRRNKRFPGQPKCKSCLVPLSGPVARVIQLISEAAYASVRDELGELEVRQLEVQGRDAPIQVRVLRVGAGRAESVEQSAVASL